MVRNLEAALPRWLDLGIGPWNVWTFDALRLPQPTYRGREGSFEARVALTYRRVALARLGMRSVTRPRTSRSAFAERNERIAAT